MHMVGIMALYSSSPPATWGSQCAMSSKSSSAAIEIESSLGRGGGHHHPAAKSVQGGLSSLFQSNARRYSHHGSHSASDVLDASPSNSCSAGSLRSSAQGESAQCLMGWESQDCRSGAVNIPASSLKSRERSPASVLQGPISRSSGGYGSPMHSMGAWESPSGAGLPPLDPHVERVSSRRRSSLSGERERWTVSRSVGFEVGNTATFPGEQQVRTAERSSSEPVRVEGFGSGASAYGNSPLDTLTLPLYTTGKSLVNNGQREAPGILEAREKILRLAEEANGIFSGATETSKVDTHVGTSADELLRDAQSRYKVFYAPVVVKAFRMAEEAHKGQFRRNGESFLSHCMETALILAATGVDSTVVAAGLLHDAIDDSNLSLALLRGALGEDVASLVIGVSKLSNLSQLARDSNTVCDPMEADRLRTMILAMVDVRVVLIKIADRLHNLRTLEALPSYKQIGIANETLEIFAPLANRLGIWSWKAELEDLCFKCLKPVEHQDLSTRLSERCREGLVMSSIRDLDDALRARGVQFIDLCGRPKNLYSVYKKMIKKKRTPEEILDVRGLRLIVSDEKRCYEALDIVHQLWRQIPGKSKDYITDSKPNGYKSLHTVVIGSDGYPLEVQIRTMKMHHQAEYGLAAHWRYKEDHSEHSAFSSERVEWARWVLTWHSEIMDTKLRVSPLGADLTPPCPFPVHNKGCPYEASCCGPVLREDDPVFVIKMENEHVSPLILSNLSPRSNWCG
ncbi:hypothetical protein M758_5G038200 [Ceratodon purpureus]|nr:hypothetical protein M758_5G038200 [Ceratodon purpureus]